MVDQYHIETLHYFWLVSQSVKLIIVTLMARSQFPNHLIQYNIYHEKNGQNVNMFPFFISETIT